MIELELWVVLMIITYIALLNYRIKELHFEICKLKKKVPKE